MKDIFDFETPELDGGWQAMQRADIDERHRRTYEALLAAAVGEATTHDIRHLCAETGVEFGHVFVAARKMGRL